MATSELIVYGVVVHLVCDWLLQNAWMSDNKASLNHPAAWVHSGIHFVWLLLVFPPLIALVIALTHILIDTRRPLKWWRAVFGQTVLPTKVHEPLNADDVLKIAIASQVAIWGDQVCHIAVIALTALLMGVANG